MIEVDVTLKRGSFELAAAFTNDGGITALFGRSGSGKSTLIHLIAGLTRPDRGRIVLDERVLVDVAKRIQLPRHRRRVGLVYQDAQLFPHLTVRQNLLFGRLFAPKDTPRVPFDAVIETLGVGHLLTRRPAKLSGGEKQRVALGRALLSNPRVLLMDEPLAALDTARKLEILPLIEHLRDEFGIPIVYVSHAVDEVARLASKVVVLEAGKVVAIGLPREVLSETAPAIDLDRFSRSSVLELQVGVFDARYGLTPLYHSAGTVHLAGRIEPPGKVVRIVVPATEVTLATQPPQNLSIRNALRGTVTRIHRNDGPVAEIGVSLVGGGSLTSLATRKALDDLALTPGDPVFALVKTAALDERPVAAGVGAMGVGAAGGGATGVGRARAGESTPTPIPTSIGARMGPR